MTVRELRPVRRVARPVAAFAAVLVAIAAEGVSSGTGVAMADTAPPPATSSTATPTPATVSADGLPTVQVNGVVWSQVTVGTTVYATGSFTSARPAGAAAGTNETPRGNLIAYDIRTGVMTSFSHALNAQGRTITASPDGTRVYVGGEFTTVDGQPRNRIAAFDTSTGSLVTSFAPNLNGRVAALTVTNATVYAAGTFTTASGVARKGFTAVAAANGAVLSWAPTADDGTPSAMVLTPDQSRVIVAGAFTRLTGAAAYGLAAVDATSGATLPWAVTAKVRNAGTSAGITSLHTDGKLIYGTGYVYGAGGNLEGAFAADPTSGQLQFLEDCHGDSYDTFASSDVLYVVSHSHACSTVGAFPETPTRSFHRATAYTRYATGTVGHNAISGYTDWYGNPAPTQLTWYPALDVGTATGQSQAAWSATGTSSYVALGGEFPKVNNIAQQGLVRFAVAASAPNKVGPDYNPTALTATAVSQSPGTVRVTWRTDTDRDNAKLTYTVVRDGQTATPVSTTTDTSTFWAPRTLGFVDTGLAAGSSHTYRVYVTDPFGNRTNGNLTTVTVSSAAVTPYTTAVLADSPSRYWRLGEPAGPAAYDRAGYDDLLLAAGTTRAVTGALANDPDTATRFAGTATGTSADTTASAAPTTFTTEAWFRTTSTAGGTVIGFGSAAAGNSPSRDRTVYLDNAGHVLFGVYDGTVRSISSAAAYNDGQWHHVAASLSPAGTALYVDGTRVARDSTATRAIVYPGYWRVGGENLSGWPSQPTSNDLAGDIDEVAVYPGPLTPARVAAHVTAAGKTPAAAPTTADGYGRAVLTDDPDQFWRLDDATGTTAADASASNAPGTFSGGVTRRVTSPVTGGTPAGTAVTTNGTDGLVTSQRKVSNPTTFSLEGWFATTSTTGGKLIGLGDQATGLSGAHDRQVQLTSTGQLSFGTNTTRQNVLTSPGRYNDGAWHQVVATLGSGGMALYVDGALVGTNPAVGAQNFSGYWRVGGDRTWTGATSNYLAASIDEVAVYPTALSAARVAAHYRASPVSVAQTPVNRAPTAAFTTTPTDLEVAFDGTTSADPDGTVTRYAWDFGDHTTGTGATPSHTYAAGGTYTAVLTVTDDRGATATATHQVTVVDPTAGFTARDRFARTTTNGLGTADLGGPWMLGYGSASSLSVTRGTASLVMPAPGVTTGAYLSGGATTAADTSVVLTTDRKTDQNVFTTVIGRRVAKNAEYRGKVKLTPAGGVVVSLTKLPGTATETVLVKDTTLSGVSWAPGSPLAVRLRATGTNPTTLALKVWPAGTAEPTAWSLAATDADPALQAAGTVGLTTYLSGTAATYPVSMLARDLAVRPSA